MTQEDIELQLLADQVREEWYLDNMKQEGCENKKHSHLRKKKARVVQYSTVSNFGFAGIIERYFSRGVLIANKKHTHMTQAQLDKIIEINVTYRGRKEILVSSSIDISGLIFGYHEALTSQKMKGVAIICDSPLSGYDLEPESIIAIHETINMVKDNAFGATIRDEGPNSVFVYIENNR